MIYLLYGSDEYARSEALAALKAQLPADLADLNLSVLDGKKLRLDTLVAACEAFPFLIDRRLVTVTDLLKHQRAGKERDELRAYLERVPPTCDLVFVESEDFDKRSAVFTYLKKVGETREFLPKEGAKLLRWLSERAAHLGAKLDTLAAQRLVGSVGADSRA